MGMSHARVVLFSAVRSPGRTPSRACSRVVPTSGLVSGSGLEQSAVDLFLSQRLARDRPGEGRRLCGEGGDAWISEVVEAHMARPF